MSIGEIGASKSLAPVAASAAARLPTPRAAIDYDFQSVLAAPPKQRLVLWLLMLLIAGAAVGLSVAHVDMIVSGNGKMITSEAEIIVQPLETSVVRSIAVKPGERVSTGATLATLDPTFTDADTAEYSSKLRQSQAAYDRISVELSGKAYEPSDPNAEELTQRDIFLKRHDEYDAKVASSERKAEQFKADLAAHKIEAEGLTEQINFVRD